MAYQHRTEPGDWRRRPRKAVSKTRRLTIRVSDAQHAELAKRAAALDLSLTDYLLFKAIGRVPPVL
jgi:uncharacterized protein (DUF1778 family)